ncbi:cache domain-containing protein, partial [Methanoregula sp.]|uniref:cache domain-containing protein n=1 Tax=Methanoregula sp. TaxID=2052170 RepID=UPI000CBB1283
PGGGNLGITNESGVIFSGEVKDGIESFVRNAAESARKTGKEAALQAFNDRNGSFVNGPLYVYAFDYNGTCLALPYQPRLVGKDLSGLTDQYGVNFTRIEIELARQGGGWIYYHYPNPARNSTVEPKISYVTPVDDTWWIGAGVYPSDESAVNAVLQAADGPGMK